MPSRPPEDLEETVLTLQRMIDKLDGMGMTFPASMLRIAHLDLQMNLHDIGEDELDEFTLALRNAARGKAAKAMLPKHSAPRTRNQKSAISKIA
jgi:hypothetical protein